MAGPVLGVHRGSPSKIRHRLYGCSTKVRHRRRSPGPVETTVIGWGACCHTAVRHARARLPARSRGRAADDAGDRPDYPRNDVIEYALFLRLESRRTPAPQTVKARDSCSHEQQRPRFRDGTRRLGDVSGDQRMVTTLVIPGASRPGIRDERPRARAPNSEVLFRRGAADIIRFEGSPVRIGERLVRHPAPTCIGRHPERRLKSTQPGTRRREGRAKKRNSALARW